METNEKEFNNLNKNLVKNVVTDVKNICYEVAREDIVAETAAPAANKKKVVKKEKPLTED